jgi:hypothetical protein
MTITPERTEVATRQPYRLWLAPEVARQLGRYLSPILAQIRTAFEDRHGTGGTDELAIDMSAASTAPAAQLVLLVTLLRNALGNDVRITLSGVRPAILGSLVTFDIPRGVVLIDSRGRRWADGA